MEGIGAALGKIFAIFLLRVFFIGALIVGGIWGGISYFSSDETQLDHRLEPIRIEVKKTVENDSIVSDTIYFYKKP